MRAAAASGSDSPPPYPGCSQHPVVIVTGVGREGGRGGEKPLVAPDDCECVCERKRERERKGVRGLRKQGHTVAQERWRNKRLAVMSVFIASVVLRLLCRGDYRHLAALSHTQAWIDQ